MCVHLHGDREVSAFAKTLINVVDGKANIVPQSDMVSVAELETFCYISGWLN